MGYIGNLFLEQDASFTLHSLLAGTSWPIILTSFYFPDDGQLPLVAVAMYPKSRVIKHST